jgi:putative transposase
VRGDKTLAYDTVSQTRARISIYIDFCNSRRPHRAHGGKTPDMIYFAPPPAAHKGA